MEDDNEKTCPFCQSFRKVQETDAYYIGKRDGRPGETKVVYGVALVHDVYYDGFYCGRATYGAEELNYCPVCGIKLKERDADG